MSLSRRDFMKLFGVSVASLLLTRCKGLPGLTPTPGPTKTPAEPGLTCYDMATLPSPTPTEEIVVTCYEATAPPVATPTPNDVLVTCYVPVYTDATPASPVLVARGRLRVCWLSFGDISRQTLSGQNNDNAYGEQLLLVHRLALDELVASGGLSVPVADLVHEAYAAAVYHVWRSAAPMTCYIVGPDNYTVASVGTLVQQSEALGEAAAAGTIDPETLAVARAALEHDMAYFALSEQDLQQLRAEAGQNLPPFDELDLDETPEAREAALFILTILAGK